MVAVILERAPSSNATRPDRTGAALGVLRGLSARIPRDAVDIAAAGTVVAALALGTLTLIATVTTDAGHRPDLAVTAALLAVCLSVYLRHIAFAVRDAVPPAAPITSALLAVLVVGAAPVLGVAWLNTVHIVAVVVALTLRPVLALPIAVVLIAAVAPSAALLGATEQEAIWLLVTTAMRVVAVYTLVWMVVALRRLRSAGAALAEQAVARERLRIDRTVTRTVHTALVAITESADRAANFAARSDPVSARVELGELVATSRSGLAQARQLIRSFQQTDFRRELASTTTLLAAAGVVARIDLPAEGPPAPSEEPLRAELRHLLARLLRDGPTEPVLITVHQVGGRWQLDSAVEPRTATTTGELG
ncbi:hypothetical protein ACFTS5_03755 [Nocardia sp. NPDC056952]|uniref:hypothetical protein n=1 Tax=Nocardia sp. NPDC056952 TaxID=3345979 RepID=UPI00363AAB81